MFTKSKINAKPILGLFLLSCYFMLTPWANAQDKSFVDECMYYGTVIDLSSDECGYQIIMDNGTHLQLVDQSVPDYFTDSLRVLFGYEVEDSISNQCGTGLLAYLTCCHPLDDPTCKAMLKFYNLDLSTDLVNGMIGNIYTFVDVSYGNVVHRTWTVDGDSIGNDSIVTFSLYDPGVYTICLSIHTTDGCYDNICTEIVIPGHVDCEAYFTYERLEVDPVDSVLPNKCLVPFWGFQFYDQSVGDVISWKWQFEDEIVEGIANPAHAFPGPGVYDVCLTIETSDNCISTYCETIYVVDSFECRAKFTYYCPVDIEEPGVDFPGSTLMQFEDLSYGNITQWHWDFGDSTSSGEQNPLHEFPETGVFDVCLTVGSPDGCHDTYCTEVIVGPPVNCNAYFEYCNYYHLTTDENVVDSIFVVGFKNFSNPEPFHSRWNFGDGTFSSETNPVHIYNVPGMYEVCLSIYTEDGCEDTYCTQIKVGYVECWVDFTWDLLVPDCFGFEVAHLFTPVLEDEVLSYNWDFGDGEYSAEPTPVHIYTNAGDYDVCLEVYYANQCAVRTCKTIWVGWDDRDSIIHAKCNPEALDPVQPDQDLSVLKVFPNPASERMVVELYSNKDQEIEFQLIGILGSTVKIRKVLMASAGNNHLEVQLNDVEAGSYIYQISSSDEILRGRVTVVR